MQEWKAVWNDDSRIEVSHPDVEQVGHFVQVAHLDRLE